MTLLRDIGAAMSPFNAFMFIQGLETRGAAHAPALRQCDGRGRLALKKHPKVAKVIFPGQMSWRGRSAVPTLISRAATAGCSASS